MRSTPLDFNRPPVRAAVVAPIIAGMLLLLAWHPSAFAGATADGASALVRTTTDELLAAVNRDKELIQHNPDHTLGLVEKIVYPQMDFARMSRWVLGKHWRKATQEQRTRFMQEFRTLLYRTYSSALTEFTDTEVIRYLPQRVHEDGKTVTVPTELPRPGGPALSISYRLRQADGQWKVVDVVVEGVSLVTTYRTSFGEDVRKAGMDGLIEHLAAKNRQEAGTSEKSR